MDASLEPSATTLFTKSSCAINWRRLTSYWMLVWGTRGNNFNLTYAEVYADREAHCIEPLEPRGAFVRSKVERSLGVHDREAPRPST